VVYSLPKSALSAVLSTDRFVLHAGNGPPGTLHVVVDRKAGGRTIIALGGRNQLEGVGAHLRARNRSDSCPGRAIGAARSV
jgi:hypothetical protein